MTRRAATGSSRFAGRLLALAFVLSLALALPTHAFGEIKHPLLFLGAAGTFEGPCGVTLDSAGDIYVSHYYEDFVAVLNPEFDLRSRIENEHPTNGPCGIAVDSAGDVFVNNWRHEVVKFTPPSTEAAWGRDGTIDPGPANGVKFDPTTNRIYVDDGTYVSAYEPSGAPVEVGGKPLRIGEGTLKEGYGLAVSAYPETAGEIYVPDAATNTVKVYDPAKSFTNPVQVIDGSGTPHKGFIYLGESEAAVNPTNGQLFVIDEVGHGLSEEPEIVVDEFNTAGNYRGQILAPPPIKTYRPGLYTRLSTG